MAHAETLIEIIMELPGKAAKAFRRDARDTIRRLWMGDRSLHDDIERNNASMRGTGAQKLLAKSDEELEPRSPRRCPRPPPT